MSNGQEIAGSNIVFHAGNCIQLDAGFEVQTGAEFLAEMENCTQTATVVQAQSQLANALIHATVKKTNSQDNILTYTVQKAGQYTASIRHIAKGQQYRLFENRKLSTDKQQIALEKERFTAGLYLLVLEQDGLVVEQLLVQLQ